MHQNLADYYLIIHSLQSLLNTQKKLSKCCTGTDGVDIDNRQQIEGECKVYEGTYQSILSRHQEVLNFPLEVFQCQLSNHKTLCQQLTESACQEFFQTALTREVNNNEFFLTQLTTIVETLPTEDFDQKSDEGDELVQDEWGDLDELDENKWNDMSELDDLGGSCESDESGELGEVSGIRVTELVEALALGYHLVN
jgi:hypothetical protein